LDAAFLSITQLLIFGTIFVVDNEEMINFAVHERKNDEK
jgi:hypothetical protein